MQKSNQTLVAHVLRSLGYKVFSLGTGDFQEADLRQTASQWDFRTFGPQEFDLIFASSVALTKYDTAFNVKEAN